MKAVAMMKKAIKDSDLKGYKWSADKKGLHWSYGIDFDFMIGNDGGDFVGFVDPAADIDVMVFIVPASDGWLIDISHDFVGNADDGVYWAAKKMIAKANALY